MRKVRMKVSKVKKIKNLSQLLTSKKVSSLNFLFSRYRKTSLMISLQVVVMNLMAKNYHKTKEIWVNRR